MPRSTLDVVIRLFTSFTLLFSALPLPHPVQAAPAARPVAQTDPAAGFSGSPTLGFAPLAVTFVNTSTNASAYTWDFGDGGTSLEASPVYTYTQSGAYTVTLQAGNGSVTDTLTRTAYITVLEPPAPVADFAATPTGGTVPLAVTFANSSTNASAYTWDFGDGSTASQLSIINSPLSITHTYTQSGVYTVTLQAGNGTITDTLTRTAYITATEPVSQPVPPPPGPTPTLTPPQIPSLAPGPPARIQISFKKSDKDKQKNWVAIYVVDDQGRAVADGTEISLSIQGGTLDTTTLQTKGGTTTTRFEALPGQAVAITASAGAVQTSQQWSADVADPVPYLDRKKRDDRYGEEAEAIVAARNALQPEGADYVAENQIRTARFDQNQLTYRLKTQDATLVDVTDSKPDDERLNLGFRITDIRSGKTSLISQPAQRVVDNNWITYQDPAGLWQM
ncbi:MAG: PKD domain-containing protein, partial [Anaerolineae bacterium]|nr:PKD domain-containing protein [Anaerolineae bacterium]